MYYFYYFHNKLIMNINLPLAIPEKYGFITVKHT